MERQEPFGASWQCEYKKIRCALRLLNDYAAQDTGSGDDELADVAADFVRYTVDRLREMTEELDERYAKQE